MSKLNFNDQKKIINLLISLPMLSNERGREALLISSGLEELRCNIDLNGPSAVVIPLILNTLQLYGRLDYEQTALGRFLNTIKSYIGIEEQEFLNSIISTYSLMTPIANSPVISDWKISFNEGGFFEKIIGENTLHPIVFLQKGLDASRSVAYIEVSTGSHKWSGTGFLIKANLVITNNHILPSSELLSKTIFRFNYQLDSNGNPEIYKDYRATEKIYYTNKELDYSIIEIESDPIKEWGYLKLAPRIPVIGSRINIIQHPGGQPKQVTMQNNFVKYADETKIQYVTSTLPGSSGSPVFNNEWEVIGVHHAGGLIAEHKTRPLYFRNEGISIKAILKDIQKEIKEKVF